MRIIDIHRLKEITLIRRYCYRRILKVSLPLFSSDNHFLKRGTSLLRHCRHCNTQRCQHTRYN